MKSEAVRRGIVTKLSWRYLSLALLAAALAVSMGCSSSPETMEAEFTVPEEDFSGFLDDYSRLGPVENEPGTLLWVNPNVDFEEYSAFMIDPVVMKLAPAMTEKSQPDPENVARITQYFREAIVREVSKHATITEQPGKGVVRLRVAITGAQVNRRNLEAWQFIPVALVITGATEATDSRDKLAVVFMEAQMEDSLTGQAIAETVQQGVGRVEGDAETRQLSKEQVEKILDHWAEKLGNRLAEGKFPS